MINVDDWAEIRRLYFSEKLGIKTIARRLGNGHVGIDEDPSLPGPGIALQDDGGGPQFIEVPRWPLAAGS